MFNICSLTFIFLHFTDFLTFKFAVTVYISHRVRKMQLNKYCHDKVTFVS